MNENMGYKTISIASNRQVTLPKKFFEILNFGNEATCFIKDNAIVIRPKSQIGGEFDELILKDLIVEGYTGDKLLEKFKNMRKKIRPAIKKILKEAHEASIGEGKSYSYKEVFGSGE